MPDVSDGSLASWVQAGGVTAFAAAVLWQLRDLKPVLKAVGETLTEVRTTLAALLERERARAERLAAQEAQRAIVAQQRGGGGEVDENWEREITGPIVEVRTPGRAATNTPRGGVPVGGYSIKRPGG